MLHLILGIVRHPARLAIRVKRLLRYAERFGILRGPRVLYKLLGSRAPLICVTIPQSKSPLLARAGTSDVPTFEQVFVWDDYGLPFKLDPKLIIDGGANVGYASVYFANVYPSAHIVAVEPESSNFELLLENTSSYPNISAIQAAIWHKAVSLRIQNPEDEKWMFRVGESESEQAGIRSITIRDILARSNATQIDILKLDIEGAEMEVFSFDYSDWLSRVKVLIIELHDHYKPGCSESFYSAVSEFQFKEYRKGENVVLVRDHQHRASTH